GRALSKHDVDKKSRQAAPPNVVQGTFSSVAGSTSTKISPGGKDPARWASPAVPGEGGGTPGEGAAAGGEAAANPGDAPPRRREPRPLRAGRPQTAGASSGA